MYMLGLKCTLDAKVCSQYATIIFCMIILHVGALCLCTGDALWYQKDSIIAGTHHCLSYGISY